MKESMKYREILIATALLLLTACTQQNTGAPQNAVEPTDSPAGTLTATEHPTSTPRPSSTATLEPCVKLRTFMSQEEANRLLIAYVNNGDVWLWHGSGCNSIKLTEFRNVYSVRFVEDDKTILFERLYPHPELRYGGTGEVWAMEVDGSNQRLLLDKDELEDMYLERGWDGGDYEYNGLGLGQVVWIPETNLVAFSTRVYFSELSYLPDDLRLLNLETGDYTTLLKAREAGEFKLSPDGDKFAIAMRDSINVFNWRTKEFSQDILTFEPVPCGCEGPHYVKPFWFPDSESLLVAIPSDELTGDDVEAALWKIDVNLRTSEYVNSYSGANRRDFFEELSSDLRYLTLYDYEQRTFNIFDLSREGQRQPVKELSGWFREWHPKSDSFLFSRSDQLLLGTMTGEERILYAPPKDFDVQQAHWIDDRYFIHYSYSISSEGFPLKSNIAIGSINGRAVHVIYALNSDGYSLSYDFAILP